MRVAGLMCAILALGLPVLGGGSVSAANRTRPAIGHELLAPIDALVAAMNRSDDRAIAALMTPDAVIVDEVVPYRWTGPRAEQRWSHDDGLLIGKRGVSASHSARGNPTFVHRDATHAYVIVPLAYDYTRGGQRQHETGLWTIVMAKGEQGWRIALLGFAKTGDTSDSTWNG